MTHLSIKDIAKLAGVVPSTVSFVINGKEKEMRISDDLAQKIRKIIHETGYVPNRSAASLRTGRTHVIGLIVEDISNSFFALLAKTIEDIAYKAGYRVVYCSTENDGKKGAELIKMLYKQVDGFIIAPAATMFDDVRKLKQAKKPVVLFDRYFPDTDLSSVLINNRVGVEKGVDALVKKKYKKIAFVITALEQVHMCERLEAFAGRMKLHSGYNARLVLKLPFSIKEGAYGKKIRAFLEKNKEIDAIFFATNYLTLEGLKVLQDLKWSIPNRVAVLSFDDHDFFKLYTPAISAIHQPLAEIARLSVEMLTQQMNERGVDIKNKSVFLEPQLIMRDSI